MNLLYSTGNEIVDEVSKINISGNIIPLSWFQTLVGESGKLACKWLFLRVYRHSANAVTEEMQSIFVSVKSDALI